MSGSSKVEYYPDGSSYKVKGELHAGWGVWKVSEKETKGFYGACGPDRHVDIGETKALERALADGLENGFKEIHIHQDARYAVDGYNQWVEGWKKNNWQTKAGKPVANLEVWKTILAHKEALKKAGVKVNCQWVKGHSGVEGNERADVCAKKGVIASYENKDLVTQYSISEPEILQTETKEEVKERKAKEKAKKKPIKREFDINEFVCSKYLIDFLKHEPAKTKEGQYLYIQATYADRTKTQGNAEDDDNYREGTQEDEIYDDLDDVSRKTQRLGIINPDATYALLIAKEPLAVLTPIIEAQNTYALTDIDNPFVIDWTKVKKAAIWNDLNTYGKDCLSANGQSVIHKKLQEYVTYLMPAPRLAREAVDHVMRYLDLYDQYRAGKLKADQVDDITKYFFNISDKGKMTQKKTTEIDKVILHPCQYDGKAITLRLTQNVDIPDAATITRMFKQEGELSVKLIRYTRTKVSFRYAVMFIGKDNTLIYSAAISNIRLVP